MTFILLLKSKMKETPFFNDDDNGPFSLNNIMLRVKCIIDLSWFFQVQLNYQRKNKVFANASFIFLYRPLVILCDVFFGILVTKFLSSSTEIVLRPEIIRIRFAICLQLLYVYKQFYLFCFQYVF